MPTYLPAQQPKPESMKAENKSVFDSPVKKGLRGAYNLLGLDDPNSQLMGMAAPLEVPIQRGATQLLQTVGGKITHPFHPAIQALKTHLDDFRPAPIDPMAGVSGEKLFTRVPPPATIRVPEGFTVSGAGPLKRSAGQAEQYGVEQAQRQRNKLAAGRNTQEVPFESIRSLEELKDLMPMNRQAPPPRLQGRATGGKSTRASKLDESSVRHIRELAGQGADFNSIAAQYPELKPASLKEVITMKTWNWVK